MQKSVMLLSLYFPVEFYTTPVYNINKLWIFKDIKQEKYSKYIK